MSWGGRECRIGTVSKAVRRLTLIAVSCISPICCRVFLESAGFSNFILSAQVRKTKGNCDFCQPRCYDHSIKVTSLTRIKESQIPPENQEHVSAFSTQAVNSVQA